MTDGNPASRGPGCTDGERLQPKRILVVEPSFLVADAVARAMTERGVEVVGPVGAIDDALALAAGADVTGALVSASLDTVLDAVPVAELLDARRIPVVLVSARSGHELPAALAKWPVVDRMTDFGELADAVIALLAAAARERVAPASR